MTSCCPKPLKEWLDFFSHPGETVESESKISTSEVKKAIEQLKNMKLTPQEREIVNAQYKWARDNANKFVYLKREIDKVENKKEEIKAEGLEEGKLAIAKVLKEKGVPILEIAKITGLTIGEVNEI